MKTLLICHDDAVLDRLAMPRWLASFSTLVGVVVIQEQGARLGQRIRKEIERNGLLRFADVAAFRAYYRLHLAAADRRWEAQQLAQIEQRYPAVEPALLFTASPNSVESERFIREAAPDIVIARCKVILRPGIFTLPAVGTFVMHPGVCPEYRNAHGCFWALTRADFDKVGMTLLRVDQGVDTGAVYGYFTYNYDSLGESHIVIQSRVVWDNLDAIAATLQSIAAGSAKPLDTSGRQSALWGHPWLSRYINWKMRARLKGR
jgi:Formyl transferase